MSVYRFEPSLHICLSDAVQRTVYNPELRAVFNLELSLRESINIDLLL